MYIFIIKAIWRSLRFNRHMYVDIYFKIQRSQLEIGTPIWHSEVIGNWGFYIVWIFTSTETDLRGGWVTHTILWTVHFLGLWSLWSYLEFGFVVGQLDTGLSKILLYKHFSCSSCSDIVSDCNVCLLCIFRHFSLNLTHLEVCCGDLDRFDKFWQWATLVTCE